MTLDYLVIGLAANKECSRFIVDSKDTKSVVREINKELKPFSKEVHIMLVDFKDKSVIVLQ